MAGSASAADVKPARPAPVYPAARAPVYVAPIHDWTGFYVGVFGGGGWGRHDYTNPASTQYGSSGGLFGGTAGYNWQAGRIVLGVEGDLAWANINGTGTPAAGLTNQSELQWLGSARGRVGWAMNNLLLYGTGGWAYGSVRNTNTNAGLADQFTVSKSGWTAGGGAEYAVNPNWSAKLEYRYTDLGNVSQPAPANLAAPYTVSNTFHSVTVGLNYKWGGPPVSRY
ncbi:MAG: porin family protein [Xanthobacteraceae bacterium]|nr:MAG: porin family protein [Xanthobacteraceae bacterium]